MSIGDTVRLERTFEAHTHRVFCAFTDPDELVHWWGSQNHAQDTR